MPYNFKKQFGSLICSCLKRETVNHEIYEQKLINCGTSFINKYDTSKDWFRHLLTHKNVHVDNKKNTKGQRFYYLIL